MKHNGKLIFVWLLMTVAPWATRAHAAPKSPHARISLIAETAAVKPGDQVELGVLFNLDPEWHIYWKNPGDSGQAPKVIWVLPPQFAVGEINWPTPRRVASGPLMNYGYEQQALLRATLTIPNPLPAEVAGQKQVEIAAHVRFLICREDCIPGEAEVVLPLRFDGPAEVAPEIVATFTEARDQQAQPLQAVRVLDEGTHVAIEFARPPGLARGTRLAFVPETPLVIANAVPQALEEDDVSVRVLAEKMDAKQPVKAIAGLIVTETGARTAWSFTTPVEAAAAPLGLGDKAATTKAPPAASTTLLWALVFAFAGGLLLNLMPCVFPVLSLKILSFVSHAHDQRKARLHGWAYAGGVLASFWALALVLAIVRASSQKLGWGFQLQSPVFVALLCALMVLVGLNLLGVFEVGLSFTRLGNVGGGRTASAGSYWGSFNTGVLATVVATPCTAPFMGTALGFALTRSTLESLGVFTSLAAGMALPYVWLTHAPGVLKRLPRPGHWMELLRQFLAFPILATVIWLLAVFSQLTGPLAVFELLGALLIVSLGGWIYGSFQRSSGRPALAVAVSAVAVLAGGWLGVSAANTPIPLAQTAAADTFWQPWSPERVAQLRAEGRAVFVNFTAAWCISCKTNEVLVFSTPEIRDAFASRDIVALKADWTNRDAVIAQELETHGRAGVPLYLFYPGGLDGKDTPPATLPSVLTKGLVLDALATARP